MQDKNDDLFVSKKKGSLDKDDLFDNNEQELDIQEDCVNEQADQQDSNEKINLKDIFLAIGSFVLDAFIVLGIVVFVRMLIVSPFQVKGHSMDYSFADNDFIIVDQFSYRFTEPSRGDVIVFRPPGEMLYDQDGILCNIYKLKAKLFKDDLSQACKVPEYFVKRIIGTPGDSVLIKEGKVFVQKKGSEEMVELDEYYLSPENQGYTCISRSNTCKTDLDREGKTYVVPEGHYFVMGDNRKGSNDSRHWYRNGVEDSYVPFDNIRGRVRLIFWPFQDMSIVSGIN